VTESRPPGSDSGPDYSDPIFGMSGLPRRPVVASAPVTGGLALPDAPVPVREYPGRTYGRPDKEAYPEQPPPDAPWPLVSGKPPAPRRRVLGVVVAVVAVLLVAGGLATTWLLVGGGSRGTSTPEQAVDGFLSGIFVTHDPADAARHVCERARDEAELAQIVFLVKQNEEAYTAARTTWSYLPIRREGRQASAEVTLTMTTLSEQASSRTITLLLVDDRGWWVCDVRTA
jgi:hypothetical protein